MNRLETKIVVMVLLGVVSIILCLIPLRFHKLFPEASRWRRIVTSALLCFGGGVLLATSFTHILPEVREGFLSSGIDYEEKPIAEIVFCAGFFLIYLVEELAHFLSDQNVHGDQQGRIHRAFSIHSQTCEVNPHEDEKEAPTRNQEAHQNDETDTGRVSSHNNYQTFGDDVEKKPDAKKSLLSTTSIRDFVTILALSLHSVFEGLVVGLEDEVEDIWKLFGAIAAHKYVISFCVALELASSKTALPIFLLYTLTFSMMTPLGIGIGAGITAGDTEGQAYILAVNTMQGLAAGTLLYVVVFEVLQRERSKSVSGFAQLFFVLLGFCAMLCVDLFAGHSHEHDDDHDHDHDHDHENETDPHLLELTSGTFY